MLTSQERFLLIVYSVFVNGQYSLEDFEFALEKLKTIADKCVDLEDFKKGFSGLVESLYNESSP